MSALLSTFAAVALLAGAAVSAKPAEAKTNFSVTYSFGDRHKYRGHSPRYDRHYPRFYSRHYYPPPRVYYPPPPPRVVVVRPAPPAVVYGYPPLAATPTSPIFRSADGRYCREYQTNVTVGGILQPGFGTACMEPDGTWRVVN